MDYGKKKANGKHRRRIGMRDVKNINKIEG